MAHTRSARKRIRQNEKHRLRNASVRSRMKTYTKRAMAAIQAKDGDALKTLLPAALAEIDKAASKGVIHRNAAARKKSSLQRMANA